MKKLAKVLALVLALALAMAPATEAQAATTTLRMNVLSNGRWHLDGKKVNKLRNQKKKAVLGLTLKHQKLVCIRSR